MKQVLGLKMTASKITASVFTALLAVAMLVAVPDADAKRMGGGQQTMRAATQHRLPLHRLPLQKRPQQHLRQHRTVASGWGLWLA
jgi:hypothetical protein